VNGLSRPLFLALAGALVTSTIACTEKTATTAQRASDAGTETSPTDAPAGEAPEAPDEDLNPDLIAERPYDSKAPSDYDGTKALPLILALHGRGDSGPAFVKALGLLDVLDEQQVLLAYPNGTMLLGASGWAAMTGVGGPDDVAYLRAVIADMASRFNVDRKRVVVVGLSMGAFMANLLACRASDKIAGALSISGSLVVSEGAVCKPARALSITLLHGTADKTVPYNGGALPIGDGEYYSAPDLYEFWGGKMDCEPESAVPARDLDTSVAGAETTGFTRSCKESTKLTLLTMKDAAHVPSIPRSAVVSLVASLTDKPRAD
jgi:polyhydroxybutyrate depolymerase